MLVFGYGSLCWRPEASFALTERRLAHVVGFRRVFAQRSTDHRGNDELPGVVVTAVSDAELKQRGFLAPDAEPGVLHGVVYTIPPDQRESVLAELDHREKGGYTRHEVEARLGTDADLPGDSVRCVFWSASFDNPQFDQSLLGDGGEAKAAAIIAKAVGPSGPNTEYLFELAAFLRSTAVDEPHISRLEALVRAYLRGAE